ncbi:MAG: class I SAM-dependent methyltransferase [Anaerolineae bacterium]|nr:class I SAM-dependent methyltransferase [Anaerolineae bacterium]
MSFYTQFAEYYEEIFSFSTGVASFLERNASSGSNCLDVGCGTGHYAGFLAARERIVMGIDLDGAMIAYAKVHYPQVTFLKMDMRDISELGAGFDTIFCIGNSGAHLPQQDMLAFISSVKAQLNPGGTWILQLMNWDYVLLQEKVTFPVIHTRNELTFERSYTQISRESVMFNTRLKHREELVFKDSVPLYPILSREVQQYHIKAGFKPVAHYANYAGDAFDPGSFSASIFVFRS